MKRQIRVYEKKIVDIKSKLILNSMLILFLLVGQHSLRAQDDSNILKAAKGSASFFSEAPLENIEASSSKIRAAMNIETGELAFVITITSFVFEKSMMQRHFNEQYLESDKYPEAKFEGMIINWSGKRPVSKTNVAVRGKLTMHGISREIEEKVTLEPAGDALVGNCSFNVRLEDYKIKIPNMVIKNIAEVVEVKIMAEFKSPEK